MYIHTNGHKNHTIILNQNIVKDSLNIHIHSSDKMTKWSFTGASCARKAEHIQSVILFFFTDPTTVSTSTFSSTYKSTAHTSMSSESTETSLNPVFITNTHHVQRTHMTSQQITTLRAPVTVQTRVVTHSSDMPRPRTRRTVANDFQPVSGPVTPNAALNVSDITVTGSDTLFTEAGHTGGETDLPSSSATAFQLGFGGDKTASSEVLASKTEPDAVPGMLDASSPLTAGVPTTYVPTDGTKMSLLTDFKSGPIPVSPILGTTSATDSVTTKALTTLTTASSSNSDNNPRTETEAALATTSTTVSEISTTEFLTTTVESAMTPKHTLTTRKVPLVGSRGTTTTERLSASTATSYPLTTASDSSSSGSPLATRTTHLPRQATEMPTSTAYHFTTTIQTTTPATQSLSTTSTPSPSTVLRSTSTMMTTTVGQTTPVRTTPTTTQVTATTPSTTTPTTSAATTTLTTTYPTTTTLATTQVSIAQ